MCRAAASRCPSVMPRRPGTSTAVHSASAVKVCSAAAATRSARSSSPSVQVSSTAWNARHIGCGPSAYGAKECSRRSAVSGLALHGPRDDGPAEGRSLTDVEPAQHLGGVRRQQRRFGGRGLVRATRPGGEQGDVGGQAGGAPPARPVERRGESGFPPRPSRRARAPPPPRRHGSATARRSSRSASRSGEARSSESSSLRCRSAVRSRSNRPVVPSSGLLRPGRRAPPARRCGEPT